MGEAAAIVYLAVCSMTDLKTRKVPMGLSLVFLAVGILLQLVWRRMPWMIWCGGILIGIFLIGISRLTQEALGYGDSIAVMVTGGLVGAWKTAEILLTALAASAVISAILLVSGRAGRKDGIPFVPFLLGAGLLSAFGAGGNGL